MDRSKKNKYVEYSEKIEKEATLTVGQQVKQLFSDPIYLLLLAGPYTGGLAITALNSQLAVILFTFGTSEVSGP